LVAGFASLTIHLIWTQLLVINDNLTPIVNLSPANPYIFMSGNLTALENPSKIYGLIAELTFTTILGGLLGRAVAAIALHYDKSEYFYGPLAKLLKLAQSEHRFSNAYVLSKVQHDGMTIGYEGVVMKLVRDSDYTPLSVTLRDVTLFQLLQSTGGVKRSITTSTMLWLIIAASDWHNIAFEVMEFDE
jgi:hypothetical protein